MLINNHNRDLFTWHILNLLFVQLRKGNPIKHNLCKHFFYIWIENNNMPLNHFILKMVLENILLLLCTIIKHHHVYTQYFSVLFTNSLLLRVQSFKHWKSTECLLKGIQSVFIFYFLFILFGILCRKAYKNCDGKKKAKWLLLQINLQSFLYFLS